MFLLRFLRTSGDVWSFLALLKGLLENSCYFLGGVLEGKSKYSKASRRHPEREVQVDVFFVFLRLFELGLEKNNKAGPGPIISNKAKL